MFPIWVTVVNVEMTLINLYDTWQFIMRKQMLGSVTQNRKYIEKFIVRDRMLLKKNQYTSKHRWNQYKYSLMIF